MIEHGGLGKGYRQIPGTDAGDALSGSTPVGALRAARLLIGLRLRRLRNRYDEGFSYLGGRKSTSEETSKPGEETGNPVKEARRPGDEANKPRAATPGKAKAGWLITVLVSAGMALSVFVVSTQMLENMQGTLGATTAAEQQTEATPSLDPLTSKPRSAPKRRVDLPKAAGSGLGVGVLQAVALAAFTLMLAAFFLSIGNGDLARPDWDLEWLATLPMSLRTLLAVRIAERTFVSVGGLLLWPFLAVAAWTAGHDTVPGLLLGLLAALPLLIIIATLRTVLDTGLRLSLSPATLRNLQAVVGVLAVLLLYLAYSAALSPRSYILEWAPWVPGWAFWLPPGLATAIVTGTQQRASIGPAFLILVLEAALIAAIGLAVLMRQLRLGVVVAGARESGRPSADRRAPAVARGRRWLLTPVQARELRLLSRDRNFLVQSLVMPVVMIGAQLLLQRDDGLIAQAFGSATALAAIAFGITAYAMMFSAFQTLNTEGHALWILYSVPRRLESILWEKAALWGVICLAYPLALFATFLANSGAPSLQLLGYAVVVLAGVPIFAVIATALGIFASDPLAQTVQRRVRLSYAYLYMLLAGLYTYAIAASSVWQRAGLMVMTALLALALWQKARDHLPYLLDPALSPPARVSLADGLVAGMMFFVLQAIAGLSMAHGDSIFRASSVALAFSIAGAATYFGMQLAFEQRKTDGVPRFLGSGSAFGAGEWRSVAWGAVGGAVAAIAALGYLWAVRHLALFETPFQQVQLGPEDELWIMVLLVVAAPVFEEFIFRGLIFGGLRRTLGLTASALASAAIFAVVHPPFSVIPVFVLGLAAALVYERTRLLIGAVAAHAVYNALVVGYQFMP